MALLHFAVVPDASLPPALYLVATPIGNLEDITLRALRVLKSAAIIACEDTRQTQKLLQHYSILTRTVSYHDHNEEQRAAELIVRIEDGDVVALVSDAGTPGVSDPGYRIVQLAIRHRLPVVPVPGPSAIIAALIASGLPAVDFRFGGFLPAKHGQRRSLLESVQDSSSTLIFYEAPHRIIEALEDIVAIMGPTRPIVIGRELTKVHEEFLRGTAAELFEQLRHRAGGVKGEITLLIGREVETSTAHPLDPVARLAALRREQGGDEKAALKALAKELGVSKSEAYREIQRRTKR